ncbi:hypothetical protein J7J18_02285 [bacterium]|nr:hypothetical protein [bacterium]
MIIDEKYVRDLIRLGKQFALVSIALSIGTKRKEEGYGNTRWGIDEWGS